MGKILVTGATGQLGGRTLRHLLARRSATDLVGLARDPARAADLAATGIEIRKGDYFDRQSLMHAFDGIDKILLIAAHAFTDRVEQHRNVILAARAVGVGHVIATPITRKAESGLVLREVTESDLLTEQALLESGLAYTILGQPPFLETFAQYALLLSPGEAAHEIAVRVPAGIGKAATATRDDLAEAQASVLTEAGHEGSVYALAGRNTVSFSDIAQILSEIHGVEVPYEAASRDEIVDRLASFGRPRAVGEFIVEWMNGINSGEWDTPTSDLEVLLRREPVTMAQYLRRAIGHHPGP